MEVASPSTIHTFWTFWNSEYCTDTFIVFLTPENQTVLSMSDRSLKINAKSPSSRNIKDFVNTLYREYDPAFILFPGLAAVKLSPLLGDYESNPKQVFSKVNKLSLDKCL